MIENLIYISPLLILAACLPALALDKEQPENAGSLFRTAKFFTLISFALTAVFYNKAGFAPYMQAGLFTLPFQTLLYVESFAILLLSRKWYTGMNISGFSLCSGLITALLSGNILILSNNLGLTAISLCGLMTGHSILLYNAERKKETSLSLAVHLITALTIAAFLLIGCLYFKIHAGSLEYHTISAYIQAHTDNPYVYASSAAILTAFIFLLGLAPLHFWLTESMGLSILPILTYFILVPLCACWAGFIRLQTIAFGSFQSQFEIFFHIIAVFSLLIGAIGSCSGKNIRKLFAYSAVFHSGMILLTLQPFTPDALNNAFIYLLSYLLTMSGICTALYGFKIKGEYIFMLSDLEGAAYKRPYICAIMTVFLFSLIGFPPFIGFLGFLTVLNDLIESNSFILLATLLLSLIIISYSYLQIIKTMYFENSKDIFDRVDTGIYLALWLNIALMTAIILHPRYLVQDLDLMLEDIFQWLT